MMIERSLLGGFWLKGVGVWDGNGWLPFQPFGWGESHSDSDSGAEWKYSEWEWPNTPKIQS